MSNYKVGDKFEIELAEIFNSDKFFSDDKELYRIKGFNSLVFDENGLNKLKKIEPEVAPRKTVKASELAVDTKVICGNNELSECRRHFAKFENGKMYAFDGGRTSWNGDGFFYDWQHMTLEDGTLVLPK